MRYLVVLIFALSLFLVDGQNPYVKLEAVDFLSQSKFNKTIDLNHVDVPLIEAGVYFLTNNYRAKRGKHSLRYQSNLSSAAYLHSEQMRNYDFFDHTNRKNKAYATLEDRVIYSNYPEFETLAENIFYGYVDVQKPATYKELCAEIVQSFVNSKGHRENILATDVNEIGCGIAFTKQIKDGYWYFYFTQNFGWRK